jgi:hypothetical protein
MEGFREFSGEGEASSVRDDDQAKVWMDDAIGRSDSGPTEPRAVWQTHGFTSRQATEDAGQGVR